MVPNTIQSADSSAVNPYLDRSVLSADVRLRALCDPTCPEEIIEQIAEKRPCVKSKADDSLIELFRRQLPFSQATIVIHSS